MMKRSKNYDLSLLRVSLSWQTPAFSSFWCFDARSLSLQPSSLSGLWIKHLHSSCLRHIIVARDWPTSDNNSLDYNEIGWPLILIFLVDFSQYWSSNCRHIVSSPRNIEPSLTSSCAKVLLWPHGNKWSAFREIHLLAWGQIESKHKRRIKNVQQNQHKQTEYNKSITNEPWKIYRRDLELK